MSRLISDFGFFKNLDIELLFCWETLNCLVISNLEGIPYGFLTGEREKVKA